MLNNAKRMGEIGGISMCTRRPACQHAQPVGSSWRLAARPGSIEGMVAGGECAHSVSRTIGCLGARAADIRTLCAVRAGARGARARRVQGRRKAGGGSCDALIEARSTQRAGRPGGVVET